jgi:hypothetical protein
MDSMRDTVKKDIYDSQRTRRFTETEIEQVWEYLYGDERLDEVFSPKPFHRTPLRAERRRAK